MKYRIWIIGFVFGVCAMATTVVAQKNANEDTFFATFGVPRNVPNVSDVVRNHLIETAHEACTWMTAAQESNNNGSLVSQRNEVILKLQNEITIAKNAGIVGDHNEYQLAERVLRRYSQSGSGVDLRSACD